MEKDPTKFCTAEEFEAGVEALSRFVSLRGEAVSRQLAGDERAVETGDLQLSAMGSMGRGGGAPGGRDGQSGPGGASGEMPGELPGGFTPPETSAGKAGSGRTPAAPEPGGVPENGSPGSGSVLTLLVLSGLVLAAGLFLAAKKKFWQRVRAFRAGVPGRFSRPGTPVFCEEIRRPSETSAVPGQRFRCL